MIASRHQRASLNPSAISHAGFFGSADSLDSLTPHLREVIIPWPRDTGFPDMEQTPSFPRVTRSDLRRDLSLPRVRVKVRIKGVGSRGVLELDMIEEKTRLFG